MTKKTDPHFIILQGLCLLLTIMFVTIGACAPATPPPATPPPYATYTAYPTYTPPPPPSPCATLDPQAAMHCPPMPEGTCHIEALTGIPYYDDEELVVLKGALTARDIALVDETLSMDRFHIVGYGWARGSYTVFHYPPGCLMWIPTPGPTPTQEVWLWGTTNTRLNVREQPCVFSAHCWVRLTLPTDYRIGLDPQRRREADGFEWYWMASCAGGAEGWVAVGAIGGEQYVDFA